MNQVIHFLIAGGSAAVLDLLLYNLFARAPLCWSRVRASSISTTFSMAYSYTVNSLFVFHGQQEMSFVRGMKFLGVTTFSCYVIQNVVICLISALLATPQEAPVAGRHGTLNRSLIDRPSVNRNIAKASAMLVAMVWNFCWYKFVVFV